MRARLPHSPLEGGHGGAPPRQARLWAAAALAAAVLAVYAPSLRHGFVWDDGVYVVDNAFVHEPRNLALFLRPAFWLEDQRLLAGSRPLFLASLLADRALWGGWAGGYHLTNVVLHAGNALWTAALGAALGLSGPAAFAAGLLFAVHPAASEAVCAVSFRGDLLAAFFSLAAAAALARRRPVSGSAAYLLGLLSKEAGALTPLAALWSRRGELTRARLAAALALLAAAATAFAWFHAARFQYALTPASAASLAPGSEPLWRPQGRLALYPPSPPPWQALYASAETRAATMLAEWGGLLGLVVRPAGLTVDRAPVVRTRWHEPGVLRGLGLLAALALAAALAGGPAGAGAAWMLAAWLPVSGVFPLYNPVAERYLYLLLPGAAWLAGAALERLARGTRDEAATVLTLALAAAVPLAAAAARRVPAWASDETLFFAPAAAPQSPRSDYNRGLIRLRQGRPAEAEAHWRAATAKHPGFAEAWTRLGALYEAAGNLDRARQAFSAGAAAPGASPLGAYAFARFLERRGESEAAAALYGTALGRDPGFVPARDALEDIKGKIAR